MLGLSNIVFKKGSVFNEESMSKDSFILHSCNAKGKWGRGVALEFRDRYPFAYSSYKSFCAGSDCMGYSTTYSDKFDSVNITSLIVSHGYGKYKSDPKTILKNTEKAINHFLSMVHPLYTGKIDIHSPKINSGLFGVPWVETQSIIAKCLEQYHNQRVTWTVWEI